MDLLFQLAAADPPDLKMNQRVIHVTCADLTRCRFTAGGTPCN